jgi:hypothetical protein
MKVKTPMINTKVVDQRECAAIFRYHRLVANISLSIIADHLDISTTGLWLMEKGGPQSKWTPELFQKAVKFLHAPKSTSKKV